MRRRDFVTLLGGAAAWPLAARAQQPERMRRIAWFGLGRADVPSPYLDALRPGLRERGWIEGHNLTISAYWATGQQEMDAVGHTLAASNPEVIVTQELTINAVLNIAAPVVFGISGNPVDAKFVESFARPGGNRTGVSYLAIDLVGKRIELLREWMPQVRHVAVLARPQHPGEHQAHEARLPQRRSDAGRRLVVVRTLRGRDEIGRGRDQGIVKVGKNSSRRHFL